MKSPQDDARRRGSVGGGASRVNPIPAAPLHPCDAPLTAYSTGSGARHAVVSARTKTHRGVNAPGFHDLIQRPGHQTGGARPRDAPNGVTVCPGDLLCCTVLQSKQQGPGVSAARRRGTAAQQRRWELTMARDAQQRVRQKPGAQLNNGKWRRVGHTRRCARSVPPPVSACCTTPFTVLIASTGRCVHLLL